MILTRQLLPQQHRTTVFLSRNEFDSSSNSALSLLTCTHYDHSRLSAGHHHHYNAQKRDTGDREGEWVCLRPFLLNRFLSSRTISCELISNYYTRWREVHPKNELRAHFWGFYLSSTPNEAKGCSSPSLCIGRWHSPVSRISSERGRLSPLLDSRTVS